MNWKMILIQTWVSCPESEPGSWFVERKKVGRWKNLKSSIPATICGFCKKNGEPVEYYSKHVLKDPSGIVVCPVLRRYNCPFCNNGGGDHAHTARFCPFNPVDRTVHGKPLPEILRTTGRNSFGKKNKWTFPASKNQLLSFSYYLCWNTSAGFCRWTNFSSPILPLLMLVFLTMIESHNLLDATRHNKTEVFHSDWMM